jgi:hypothetical protein
MKCIQCGTDNNLKDRTANQGRCSRCNHPFVFEPNTMKDAKITDPFFAKVISDISVNNTLFFTTRQLLYFLDQRLKKKPNLSGSGKFFVYFFLGFWVHGFLGGFIGSISGAPFTSIIVIFLIYNLMFISLTMRGGASSKISFKSRQSRVWFLMVLGILILIIGVFLALASKSLVVYISTSLIGLSYIWLGVWQNKRIQKIKEEFVIKYTELQDWLKKWQQVNGPINHLLTNPVLGAASNNPDSEVTAYSFDRLVICDTTQVAQLLIANNFHFEHNCAILTIDGYPENIFDTVLAMFKRNPQLVVYAFHSATPQGVKLTHRLNTDIIWFKSKDVIIIDLGLQPKQVLNSPRHLHIECSQDSAQAALRLPPQVRESLTQTELAWLDEGNYVELESFSPRRLIQILKHGIATGGALDISSSNDSSTIIYGVESFG